VSDLPPRSSHRFGRSALRRLGDDIVQAGHRRILLVTGGRSFTESGAELELSELGHHALVHRWSGVSPNTDSGELHEGLAIVADFQPDYVLGIGGGSVMDMAKLLCAYPSGISLPELTERIDQGAHLDARAMGLGLAPTTSGSGSEATHFAVVYIGEDKYSVAGHALRAGEVALDPQLPLTGSAHQRATSGMDAICQAIESRWAAGATHRSRRYADFALAALVPSIRGYVAGEDHLSPTMMLGSHLAGRAIDISKTTAAHALSYAITKSYGVDHGNAVAMTLGYFIEDHDTRPESELQATIAPTNHRESMNRILKALGASDGSEGRRSFLRLLRDLHLPASLSEVGDPTPGDLERLADSVNVQRLGNNPHVYTGEQLVKILERAADTAVD
jgi:alcohol dehydrogenase